MKLPVFNKCWCCELEIGGIILAWIGIITGGIILITLICIPSIILTVSCERFMSTTYLKFITNHFECVPARIVYIILATVLFAVVSIHILIYIVLIKGVQNRNPEQIIPAVVIQGFGTISIFVEGLLTFSADGILDAIIGGAFMAYFFLCLYSLYVKIRDEKVENQDEQLTEP